MSTPQNLRITLVQADLAWENKAHNLSHLREMIELASPSTDVIVLPEMFSTGFSMNAEKLAEPHCGDSFKWMQQLAKDFDSAIVGSLITEDQSKFYNRLYWVFPDGTFQQYDKRHLFSFANEERFYTGGTDRILVQYKGWRIMPLICYDLRFPVWSRNVNPENLADDQWYDALIYVANWPEARRKPWNTLLEARAHENQAYVIGVNRVGFDGNQIHHSGDSAAYSPKGDMLSNLTSSKEGVETVILDYQALTDFRDKFTVWKDKDLFELK